MTEIADTPHFYPDNFVEQLTPLLIEGLRQDHNSLPTPYVLCFHSTARAAKRWPNDHWVQLGKVLTSEGYQVLFPWGNEAEKKESSFIASQIPGAMVSRAFSIEEAYRLIAHAALTIGVDTGLTHLAAVLGKPTVEIYCDSPRWKTEGFRSNRIANVGDFKQIPALGEVLQACKFLLLNKK